MMNKKDVIEKIIKECDVEYEEAAQVYELMIKDTHCIYALDIIFVGNAAGKKQYEFVVTPNEIVH